MRVLQMITDIRNTDAPDTDTIEKVILRIPPRNAALAGKIHLQPLAANLSEQDLSPDDPDLIEVHLTNGQVLKRTEGVVLGSLAKPLARADLRRKLKDCTALLPALPAGFADRVMALGTCPEPAGFAADLRHLSR